MVGAIAIGSVICIIAAIAGDTSQDLKTGFLLGATPKKQQYGELIGVCVSAVAIGAILYLLNAAWGFGTDELGAPQAMMMKMVVVSLFSFSEAYLRFSTNRRTRPPSMMAALRWIGR